MSIDVLKTKRLPVTFQVLNELGTKDLRFTKVKIWLMHTGVNFNASVFEEDSIVRAIPTLANTPILGYVENDDFSDHRREINEDGVVGKYLGRAYGVIPEDNQAQFEYRVCDDGVERKFLTVQGLLWNKLDDVNILQRDGIKSQSMELADDVEGYVDENGLFNFVDFKFDGACILGDDVDPAMINSTIEIIDTFAKLKKDFATEIKSMLEMYQKIEETEGGNGLDKLDLLKKFSLTEEEVKEKGINLESISFEELEGELEKLASSDNTGDDSGSDDGDSKDAEITFSQIAEALGKDANDVLIVGENTVGYFADDKIVKKSYTVADGKIEFSEEDIKLVLMSEDEVVSTKDTIQNFESENAKLVSEKEELETKITEMSTKVEELEGKVSEFETTKKQSEISTLLEQYSMLNGVVEFESLKDKAMEYAIDELEKEIALIYVKNSKNLSFSKKSDDDKIIIDTTEIDNDKDSVYGDLFDKYGN